jgi:5'-methylthioinosine phosphorylase
MTVIGIIGGSGLAALGGLEILERRVQQTPYGAPSGPLSIGRFADQGVIFVPRHGQPHAIPPHKVNYRANIWALRENGAAAIIGINAVGGITAPMHPGTLVVPDQIIDYTWGRAHTYFEEDLEQVVHIDFTQPYSAGVRKLLVSCASDAGVDVQPAGTYGATQGPRLESAAEILRMERDGCDIVGMTGMPEAALARELEIPYASISVVANWAAGKSDGPITMAEIQSNLRKGMGRTLTLLQAAIRNFDTVR